MTESREQSSRRKDQHLQIALEDSRVQRPGPGHGLDAWRFEMLSLPELDLGAVTLDVELLGKPLSAPLLVGAMTGGSLEAGRVNRILAEAAERTRVGFCLGSQRSMLDLSPESAATFQLRDVAPSTLILGNIGGVQLRDIDDPSRLEGLASVVGADGVYVHLNPLQESIQPEGDHDWRGVFDAIGDAASQVSVPVLVKEVGGGLGDATLRKLAETGIAGVETAGVGGTSWAQIEALRFAAPDPRQVAGEVLRGFGTPTAESVVLARRHFPRRLVIGSGGLRTGLDAAKCIALGADAAAMAWPFLVAAQEGVDGVVRAIEAVKETLRITMFLVGARDVGHLRRTPLRPVGQPG